MRGKWLLLLMGLFLLAAGGCAQHRDRLLVDCDRNPVPATFVAPRGEVDQILLGVPLANGQPTFSGQMSVEEVNGEPLCDFSFNSETAPRCNWLANRNLDAYILTWNNEDGWANLKLGHEYRVTADFNSQLPPDSPSLWLSWVQ